LGKFYEDEREEKNLLHGAYLISNILSPVNGPFPFFENLGWALKWNEKRVDDL
jgi:hypothetical protein